jgi:hypothetical protein
MRRRILSIVGALGLVTGLISSGVAAQADTSMSDSTFNSMVSFYQLLASFSSNFCYAQPASTTSCPPAITQTSTTSNNVAVCVETDHSATPSQTCSIAQTNTTGNNIAIVVQVVSRNSNDSNQNATQDASIQQDNVGGSNFAAVVQIVKQSSAASGDQSQTDNQGARIEQNGATQLIATGHNLAILFESSKQSGSSQVGGSQTQFSNEDVNTDPHHINQYSSGVSTASASQNQVQQLSGTGLQSQTIDPRCCSIQQSNLNDKFTIQQFASQANNHQPTSSQDATSVAQCSTSGNCTTSSTTSQNGATTTVTCGPTSSCTAVVVCSNGTCPEACFNSEGCFVPPPPCFTSCETAPVATASFRNKELAIAPLSRSMAKPLARSAPSAALLT